MDCVVLGILTCLSCYRGQNELLDGMGDGFQNVGDLLHGSLARIGTMLESGGAKHMCYLVGFSVFVMAFLWWLMKRAPG